MLFFPAVSLQYGIEVSMAMQNGHQPVCCSSIRYEAGAFFVAM